MNYSYIGRNSVGRVSGEIDAVTTSAVADILNGRGITPLKITPAAGSPSVARAVLPRLDFKQWLQPKVKPLDVLMFSRQLHTLLKAGVPILRAFAGLEESATSERMKLVLAAVRQGLASGVDMSMSLAQHPKVFDSFYVALVRVGELTGRLDEVLLQLFKHIEFEMAMGQQVKTALRYPTFVLVAMVAAVAVINVMVIPAFASVFKSFGAELPLPTRILLATSWFTVNYGWLLVLGAVAGWWGFRHWVATDAGRLLWDRSKLRLPLAGRIVRMGMLARFARSLALSLKSGVPVAEALTVVAHTVENRWIGQKIEGMRLSVERGDSILRSAAAAGVFTPIVLQMIGVGEETGAIDELMDEVADLYTNEVQYELQTLGQQIEPIMIIFLGALVLMLALGVFLPMWDLGRVALKP